MKKNKLITIRIDKLNSDKIKALKEVKKNNNEVFNLSKIVRDYLDKEFN